MLPNQRKSGSLRPRSRRSQPPADLNPDTISEADQVAVTGEGERSQVRSEAEPEPEKFEFDVRYGQKGWAVGGGGVPGSDEPCEDGPAAVGELGTESGAMVTGEFLDPPGEIESEGVAIGDDGDFGRHG
jgi:hypothetical protein